MLQKCPLARGRGRGGCCCPGPHPWACVGLGLAWGLGIFQRAHSTERRRCRSCTCRVCRCASRSRMRCRPESWRASWLHRVRVCVCAQPAAEPRAGRVREHWHGVLGHTLQPQPAPLAVSPASRQLRPQSAANSSLGHACGWQLKPRPCVRLAMGRGAPLVSMIARGVDRAFLSPHCRSVYPRRPAGGLSSSRRPSRSSSRAHCDRGGPGLRHSVRDGEIVELDFSRFPGIAK